MRRRRPAAVYRVIDEDELLGGGSAGEQVDAPPTLEWPAVDGESPARPRLPRRRLFALIPLGVLVAVVGALLPGAPAAPRPAPTVPRATVLPPPRRPQTARRRSAPRGRLQRVAVRRAAAPPPRAAVIVLEPVSPDQEFGFER